MVKTGLEIVINRPPSWIKGRRLGLLCNHASVSSGLIHSRLLINDAFPNRLKAIFTPQHGLFAEKQDNMKESGHGVDEELNLPVFSLYSETRAPLKEQLELIDVFVVDLQDCGCRVYTFIWTMLLAMKACAENGVALAVLDRPNPIGGSQVEGNILDEGLFSFVGLAPIPMRHGMTIGELALFFKDFLGLDLELHVVAMEGWNRDMYFDSTGLPWVFPSPNMPSVETAIVYPGQVILEGTNLSEGRGTTMPFEIFGAPYLKASEVIDALGDVEGALLRYQAFEPTFNKWQGKRCQGFQIHVTDRQKFLPYRFTLNLLSAINRVQGEEFSWTPPPYEYDFWHLPADLIIGSKKIRTLVEQGAGREELHEALLPDEKEFEEKRQPFLLY